jgi:hypothetical protein
MCQADTSSLSKELTLEILEHTDVTNKVKKGRVIATGATEGLRYSIYGKDVRKQPVHYDRLLIYILCYI